MRRSPGAARVRGCEENLLSNSARGSMPSARQVSAPKRRPCRNRNFCASTPDWPPKRPGNGRFGPFPGPFRPPNRRYAAACAASPHSGPRRQTSRIQAAMLYGSDRAFRSPRTRNLRTPNRSFNQAFGNSAVSDRLRYAPAHRSLSIRADVSPSPRSLRCGSTFDDRSWG